MVTTTAYDLSAPEGLADAALAAWDMFAIDAPSDVYGSVMSLWFAVAGEMFWRGDEIPHEWNYGPGASNGRLPEDEHWGLPDVSSDDLALMGDRLHDLYEECKANDDSY